MELLLIFVIILGVVLVVASIYLMKYWDKKNRAKWPDRAPRKE